MYQVTIKALFIVGLIAFAWLLGVTFEPRFCIFSKSLQSIYVQDQDQNLYRINGFSSSLPGTVRLALSDLDQEISQLEFFWAFNQSQCLKKPFTVLVGTVASRSGAPHISQFIISHEALLHPQIRRSQIVQFWNSFQCGAENQFAELFVHRVLWGTNSENFPQTLSYQSWVRSMISFVDDLKQTVSSKNALNLQRQIALRSFVRTEKMPDQFMNFVDFQNHLFLEVKSLASIAEPFIEINEFQRVARDFFDQFQGVLDRQPLVIVLNRNLGSKAIFENWKNSVRRVYVRSLFQPSLHAHLGRHQQVYLATHEAVQGTEILALEGAAKWVKLLNLKNVDVNTLSLRDFRDEKVKFKEVFLPELKVGNSKQAFNPDEA